MSFKGEDYDFAAGAIKGLRTWDVDDQGRLHGVTHKTIWTPGENVAKCEQGAGRYTPCPTYWTSCSDPTCVPHKGHFIASEPHAFDPDCSCGFWAYDEHTFKPHGAILGIIEGFGKTTVGTRGFRCEKARIVALCRNLDAEVVEMDRVSLSLWLRLKRLYPEVQFFDEIDEMVERHGEVMRSWGPVGEDFWEVKPPANDMVAFSAYSQALSRLSSQLLSPGLPAALPPSPAPTHAPLRWRIGGLR